MMPGDPAPGAKFGFGGGQLLYAENVPGIFGMFWFSQDGGVDGAAVTGAFIVAGAFVRASALGPLYGCCFIKAASLSMSIPMFGGGSGAIAGWLPAMAAASDDTGC